MRRALALCLVALSFATPALSVRAAVCRARVERVEGGSWQTRRVEDLRGTPQTWRLTADEGDPRFVAIADNEGVLVTSDGGCTWKRSVEYAEFVLPEIADPLGAVLAGSGRDRSLHVLISAWMGAEMEPTLLSSFDDGATWTASPAPAGPYGWMSYALTASPSSPGVVYLLARHVSAAGGVYSRRGNGEWRRRVVMAHGAPESCDLGATCLSRTIDVLVTDPAARDVLWAFAGAPPDAHDSTLGRSADGGGAWTHAVAPEVSPGAPLVDVVSGRGETSVTLVGDRGRFATTRDEGRSWAVARIPELLPERATSSQPFAVAHFDRGNKTAVVLGSGPYSGWAGNVLAFDGRRWSDVSPAAFSGYGRADAEGNPLTFAALASTEGPLLALTSTGELMSLRL